MSRMQLGLGVAALALGVLGACSAQQRAMMAAMNKPQDDSAMSGALGVANTQGVVLDAAWAQGQVVVVDFWASWCQPCQHSIPFYRRMHERWAGRGLRLVGVNTDDDREDFLSYLAVHPMPFSLVYDEQKALSQRFAVMQLPTTFLFDRKGRLRKTRSGFDPTEARQVEDEIRLLIGEPAP